MTRVKSSALKGRNLRHECQPVQLFCWGGGGGGYRVSSVILKRQDIKKSNYIKHMPNYVGEIIHTVCMNA